jgi:hypothetical protein
MEGRWEGRARQSLVAVCAQDAVWSLRGQRDIERGSTGAHTPMPKRKGVCIQYAQCVFRVSEGPEADAHARSNVGQKEWKSG